MGLKILFPYFLLPIWAISRLFYPLPILVLFKRQMLDLPSVGLWTLVVRIDGQHDDNKYVLCLFWGELISFDKQNKFTPGLAITKLPWTHYLTPKLSTLIKFCKSHDWVHCIRLEYLPCLEICSWRYRLLVQICWMTQWTNLCCPIRDVNWSAQILSKIALVCFEELVLILPVWLEARPGEATHLKDFAAVDRDQCDHMGTLFFYIWPITTMKLCPVAFFC